MTSVHLPETQSCAVDDCSKQVFARGMCQAHYSRWYRHGHPTAGRVTQGKPLATLKNWVRTRDRGACWRWPYGQNGLDYGVVKWRGRYTVATRVALNLDGRPAPDETLHALHSCDNPSCVNPGHLRWGTPSDNMRDCVERGRDRWSRARTILQETE